MLVVALAKVEQMAQGLFSCRGSPQGAKLTLACHDGTGGGGNWRTDTADKPTDSRSPCSWNMVFRVVWNNGRLIEGAICATESFDVHLRNSFRFKFLLGDDYALAVAYRSLDAATSSAVFSFAGRSPSMNWRIERIVTRLHPFKSTVSSRRVSMSRYIVLRPSARSRAAPDIVTRRLSSLPVAVVAFAVSPRITRSSSRRFAGVAVKTACNNVSIAIEVSFRFGLGGIASAFAPMIADVSLYAALYGCALDFIG